MLLIITMTAFIFICVENFYESNLNDVHDALQEYGHTLVQQVLIKKAQQNYEENDVDSYKKAFNAVKYEHKEMLLQTDAVILLRNNVLSAYNNVPSVGHFLKQEEIKEFFREKQHADSHSYLQPVDINMQTYEIQASKYKLKQKKIVVISYQLSQEYTLVLISDISSLSEYHDSQLKFAIIIGICAALLALVIGRFISQTLTQRLQKLGKAANGLRTNDYETVELPPVREDEIGDLTLAFDMMINAVQEREQELKEQAQQKQELLDALAHEMRTPLTAIVGAARMIPKAPDKMQEMTDLIVQECMRLSGMDKDLMRLTWLNNEPPHFTCFSSKAMAEEALSVFDQVELVGESVEMVGDIALLIQLLRNLVNNALHSDTKQPVRVTLLENGFSVRDEGRGMTQEQIDHAFEAFWKGDKARTRKNGGTGLGLTICAKIAELHKADLKINSYPNQGTTMTFLFTVPLQPDDEVEIDNMIS